jgi:hypothetical protein
MRNTSKIAKERAAQIIADLAGGNKSLSELLAIAYERGVRDAAQVLEKTNER